MIESEASAVESWKKASKFLQIFIILWLVVMPVLFIVFKEFSPLIILYLAVLIALFYFRNRRKKIVNNIYAAKMDEEKIILNREDENSMEIKWEEVSSLSRVKFTTPPLYILTLKKYGYRPFIFPTSEFFFNFYIGFNGFGFSLDFSKMGRFIRKIKRRKKISSYYLFNLKRIVVK